MKLRLNNSFYNKETTERQIILKATTNILQQNCIWTTIKMDGASATSVDIYHSNPQTKKIIGTGRCNYYRSKSPVLHSHIDGRQ